jgi:excisionase family DNA binding protein
MTAFISQSTTPRRAKLAAAAEYAGVSAKTLRRRISDGTLPGYRLGTRNIVVDLDDVDRMFRRIPTAAAAAR